MLRSKNLNIKHQHVCWKFAAVRKTGLSPSPELFSLFVAGVHAQDEQNSTSTAYTLCVEGW